MRYGWVRKLVSLWSVLALAMCVLGLSAAVAAGEETSVFAWGNGTEGKLGNGREMAKADVPLRSEVTDPIALAGNAGTMVALLEGGTVETWGSAYLGNGTGAQSAVPVPVSGLTGATAVAAGDGFDLALLSDGTVQAWGSNGSGQLGDDTTTTRLTPVAVNGLSNVVAIEAGEGDSYALLSNGTVMAWGNNGIGQLGDPESGEQSSTPVEVRGLSEVTAISAGDGFALALLRNGEVRSWGYNQEGELGDGFQGGWKAEPVSVVGLGEVTAISAGHTHSVALLSNGTVEAWGWSGFGDIGDGEHEGNDPVPVAVTGLSGVHAVSAGGDHNLALLEDGKLQAWGGNEFGEIGIGYSGKGNKVSEPVDVGCGLTDISLIATSFWDAYAVGPTADNTCPEVTSLEPREGAGSGGTSVTIHGNEFTDVSAVSFGGVKAESFTVESPTVIKAIAPPGSGKANVLITTEAGVSLRSSLSEFTYRTPPSITRVTPHDGPLAGGTTVTITGTELKDVTGVTFGSSLASSFEMHGSSILAQVPAGAEGTVDVKVTAVGGTNATAAGDEFSYVQAPEIGRCVAFVGGAYSSGACTSNTGLKDEWDSGFLGVQQLVKRGFAVSGSATLGAGGSIACKLHASGEYTGARTAAIAGLVLTECTGVNHEACESADASTGEILSAPLDARLGVVSGAADSSSDRTGLELSAASGEVLAEFSCAGTPIALKGAVIVELKKANKMSSSLSWKAKGKKGVQKPASFEDGPTLGLEAKVGAGAYAPASLTVEAATTSEEAIDINTGI
jgi:hypothetical protein